MAIAATVLLPVAWRTGALRDLRRRWRPIGAFAVAEMVIPFPLIAAGEQRVSSSLAAILIATVPLMIALIALRFEPAERVGGSRLIGLLIGLAGVVVLLGIDVAGSVDELLGAGMILVASAGYAVGPLVVNRHFGDVHPLGPITAALGISTVLLAPPALLAAPDAIPSALAVGSILVLGIVCSAIAFLLFFTLIGEVGPGRASVITYVNPAIALLLGVTILDERLGLATLVGLLMILIGSWIATRRQSSTTTAAPGPTSAKIADCEPI